MYISEIIQASDNHGIEMPASVVRVIPARNSGNADFLAGNSTVFYNGRYLYSQFEPQKNILKTIADIEIRENTLVLCVSPALCYGIEETAKKLSKNSALLLIENDPALFELALSHIPESAKQNDAVFCLAPARLSSCEKIFEQRRVASDGGLFDFWNKSFPQAGTFRRVLRVDFSAGTALNPRFYDALERSLAQAVSLFWKNRATLMYLGRLYCRNIFLNLSRLPRTAKLEKTRIEKPVLVIASGPSTDALLALNADLLSAFYIIAVDTALPALISKKIVPNLVVQVEAQFAIEAAFISARKTKLTIAADLVSRCKNADYYFFSAFTSAAFIDTMRARKILPLEIAPMGSVALTAVELSLRLRARDDIPVFVCGIDFSLTAGKTHCKGAPAHTAQLISSYRLCPAGDVASSFKEGARFVQGKNPVNDCLASGSDAPVAPNAKNIITDPVLLGYCASFSALFSKKTCLFDAGVQGLSLGIPRVSLNTLIETAQKIPREKAKLDSAHAAKLQTADAAERYAAIKKYLCEEESALQKLKRILCGKEIVEQDEREKQITEIIQEREYLFLHFPDGYTFSPAIQFIKRVRAELDFFLKDIHRAIIALEKTDF